jgi:hypothetical protein
VSAATCYKRTKIAPLFEPVCGRMLLKPLRGELVIQSRIFEECFRSSVPQGSCDPKDLVESNRVRVSAGDEYWIRVFPAVCSAVEPQNHMHTSAGTGGFLGKNPTSPGGRVNNSAKRYQYGSFARPP